MRWSTHESLPLDNAWHFMHVMKDLDSRWQLIVEARIERECPYTCCLRMLWKQLNLYRFFWPGLCSWLYRMKPSVTHEPFHPREPSHKRLTSDFSSASSASVTPTQLRWKPPLIPEEKTNFIDGLFTICGAGSPFLRHGYAVHMYARLLVLSLLSSCFHILQALPLVSDYILFWERGFPCFHHVSTFYKHCS